MKKKHRQPGVYMNAKNKVILVLVLLITLSPWPAQAQDVGDEEITVVGEYKPTISNAVKIARNPEIREEKVIKPEFNYEMRPAFTETGVKFDSIMPARLKTQSTDLNYKNTAKAGIGNYRTAYAEFWANNFQTKNINGGFHFRHLSSAGDIDEYAFPGNSINEADAYGTFFLGRTTLQPSVSWSRNAYHYYGFKPSDYPHAEVSDQDIKQVYNRAGIKTRLFNNPGVNGDFSYNSGIRYDYLWDRYESKEHRIGLDGWFEKDAGVFSFPDEQHIRLNAGFDAFINSDTLKDASNSLLNINPLYHIKYRQYRFYGGFRAMFQLDNTSYLRLYPEVGISVEVIRDKLITFGGIEGNLTKNTLYSLSSENPFVTTSGDLLYSNTKLAQFGGIRGNIGPRFDYRASFRNSTIDQLALFVNDTLSHWENIGGNQFSIIYDKARYSMVELNLAFHLRNKLDIVSLFRYHSYMMDKEDKPWHKPKVELNTEFLYFFNNALTVGANFTLCSGMYAKIWENGAEKAVSLKPKADLSLRGEYKITGQLSAFLNINNILNTKREYWYNYPGYKLNVLAGVTYRF